MDDLESDVFSKDLKKVDFKATVEKTTGLKISDKESEYLYKMVDVNRNGIVGPDRRPSFFYGTKDPSNCMVKLGGSRLSIFRENYAMKPYGSRLSVFSGHRDSYDRGVVVEEVKNVQEKERLMVPA